MSENPEELRIKIAIVKEMLGEAGLQASLDSLIKKLIEVQSTIGDSKFTKGLKQLGKTMKGMVKASLMSTGLGFLASVLEPVLELFQLFSPIFEALGALIQAIFLPVMMDLMPIITFIANAIILLIPYAMQLWDIIKLGLVVVFQAIILVIQKAWEGLQILWGWLVKIGQFLGNVFIGIWNVILIALQLVGKFIVEDGC